MERLLYLGLGIGLLGAVPFVLRTWLARRGWTRVVAKIVTVETDGTLLCALAEGALPASVRIVPFGEGKAAAGDRIVLHHPPGRPDMATHGSAAGHLVAAALAAGLGLAALAAAAG